MRLLLVAAFIALAFSADAQTINQNIGGGIGFTFDGGISSGGANGSGPPAHALLAQTGVCILAQTGSCILVQ